MDRQELTRLSEIFIRTLLKRHLPPETPVYLYGSRARNDQHWNSDYDFWVDAELPTGWHGMVDELLEESFVPFKVDIVTTAQLRGGFGDQVRRDSVRWM